MYTNNSMAEKELVRSVLFIIVARKTKYLEINLNEAERDLCEKNYKNVKEINRRGFWNMENTWHVHVFIASNVCIAESNL